MKNARRPNRFSDQVDIDLAPMIDCVFILLIFFIVTSVFIRDPGVRVDRPDVPSESAAPADPLVVAITDADAIFMDGQQIPLDALSATLRAAWVDPSTPLIIRADRMATHGIFAEVHAAAKEAGIEEIQFATKDAP